MTCRLKITAPCTLLLDAPRVFNRYYKGPIKFSGIKVAYVVI